MTERIYQPQSHIIVGISNANPALVTTLVENQYRVGDVLRIYIPTIPFDMVGWGMSQLNNAQVNVIDILSSTEFYINVDSTLFEPWVFADNDIYVPQTIPVGELADTIYGASLNTLPSLRRPYTQ